MIEDKIYSIPIQPKKKKRKLRFKKESMAGALLREIKSNTKMKIAIPSSMIVLITSLLLIGYFGKNWQQDTIYGDNISLDQLPQTGNDDNLIKYCNPDTGIGFKSLSNKYVFTAENDTIKIRYQYTPDFSASIYKSNTISTAEVISSQISIYNGLYSNVEYHQKPSSHDDITIYEIQYDRLLNTKPPVHQHITNVYMFKTIDQDIYTIQYTSTNNYPQYSTELDTLSKLLASLETTCVSDPGSGLIQNPDADINISIDKDFWDNYTTTQNIIAIISKETYLTSAPIDLKVSWQDVGPNYDTSILVNTIQEISDDKTLKPGKQNINNVTFYFMETKTGRYYIGYVKNIQKLVSIELNYSKKDNSIINQLIANISFGINTMLPETGEASSNLGQYALLPSKLATTKLFTHNCVNVDINEDTYLVCTNQIGTGYFVNEKGFILTDTTTVSPAPIDIFINGILYGFDPDNLYDYYATDAILNLSKQDISADQISALNSQDYSQYINALIIHSIQDQIADNTIIISNLQTNIYTQYEEPFKVDFVDLSLINASKQYQVQKVSTNVGTSAYIQVEDFDIPLTNNLTLMKVIQSADTLYPSINLSNNVLDFDTSLYTLGFSADNISALLADDFKVTISQNKEFHSVAINTGLIGLIGGPVVDYNNTFIGQLSLVPTRQTSATPASLLTTDTITTFLKTHNISDTNNDNEINNKLSSAVSNINNQYYKLAVNDFNYVSQASKITKPILAILISELDIKIANGEDNSPILQIFAYNFYKQELYISTALISAILISLTVLIKSFQSLKKNMEHKDKHTRYIKKNHSIALQTHVISNPL